MTTKKRGFKIEGVVKDKEFNALPFGRQIEHWPRIKAFQAAAKKIHVSQKRTTHAAAIKEAKALTGATQWYYECFDSKDCRDDSFEFFYL